MTSEIPEAIGAYQIRRRLGAGGMGEVFLAWDERLKRHVAIKRILPDVLSRSDSRQRFQREARAAAALNHPAIVQIFELLEDEAGDSIVMEYVEGSSVAELVAAGAIDGATALRVARQVAEGLAEAHRRGLVHRDLKAENVIVTAAGRAKILDFGLAKRLSKRSLDESLTRDGAILGTVRAMSPEQAGGEAVGRRSDLYSLGVLLYEMLTGLSPFRGENALQIHRKVLMERPPSPRALRPELPEALSTLIESLLEKDPERRPGSAGEVVETLEEVTSAVDLDRLLPALGLQGRQVATDAPTVAPPSVAESRATKRSVQARRRRPRRAMLAVAAAVGAVAVVAWIGVTGRGRPQPVHVVVAVESAARGPLAEHVVLGVEVAAVSSLQTLDGVTVVDPSLAATGPPSAIRRAQAADELLVGEITGAGPLPTVVLRRVRGSAILWTESFEVPPAPDESLALANAVRIRLRRAYPEHGRLPGVPELEVRDRDYEKFLALKGRVAANLGERDLESLEAILETSPRFLDGYLLAAEVARTLKQLDRALRWIRRAEELAPADPRPVRNRFKIEVQASRLEAAKRTLAKLEEVVPGDLLVYRSRAQLLDAEGRTAESLKAWQRVVEMRPSWRNLFGLAAVELDLGGSEIDNARRHLEQLLRISPGNFWGLSKLAQLELRYGDPQHAETLYRELGEVSSLVAIVHNLGWSLFLQHRFDEAAEVFQQALDQDPSSLRARLGLADAEHAAGNREVADSLYREILEAIGAATDASAVKIIEAQCLARLGEFDRAVEVTQQVLWRESENVETIYQAALVYALAGDLRSARVNAVAALRRGLSPSSFQIPGFEALLAYPEFQGLLVSR